MPSPEENLYAHERYDWSQGGEEWSSPWGGSDYLWWGTIFPRIQNLVPVHSILEIAPGYGRCTAYLKDLCQELTIVDITEKCIAACRERFGAWSHIRYVLNDGRSLAMVPDESVDFVFSWDSLVHAERDVMEGYIRELARVMRPGAFGFIHHSNFGACARTDREPANLHWRGTTMRADLFETYCRAAGLACVAQELVPWGGSEAFTDCFSLFGRETGSPLPPLRRLEHSEFRREIERIQEISQLYGRVRSRSRA
jgi:SAM-dependent methyltransferase